jgi:hypothetical protein
VVDTVERFARTGEGNVVRRVDVNPLRDKAYRYDLSLPFRHSSPSVLRLEPPGEQGEKRRDGITTTYVKKTIWFHDDEAEALRLRAFEDRRSVVLDRSRSAVAVPRYRRLSTPPAVYSG